MKKPIIIHTIPALIFAFGYLVASLASAPTTQVAAACTNPASPYGLVTVTYNVPVSGTYRVWSRIIAPDSTNNSYYLQVDGGCAINVGDATIPTNQLTFVDYQDGNSATKINVPLTAGNHTFVLTGREPGVSVDRVVFALNASCLPLGTGDNCADTATPTPTATASATPTPTATPVPSPSDLNSDAKVNVFDLSILLSHWGGTGLGDINGDGTVNIFDLSRLLTSWTG